MGRLIDNDWPLTHAPTSFNGPVSRRTCSAWLINFINVGGFPHDIQLAVAYGFHTSCACCSAILLSFNALFYKDWNELSLLCIGAKSRSFI